jgi:alcohol dehydrogenase class IV
VSDDFVWRDAGRAVVFRGSALDVAPELLAESGMEPFDLLSTERHLESAGGLASAAAAVHEVPATTTPATGVTTAAARLLDRADATNLVALGGGRTIDTAKAIAAVTGARVAAIPTTMSGAEMTGIHRLPEGAESRVRTMVRPALVIADPGLMTSAPEAELRASSMNALAHGADSLYTPFANPVSRMTALRGAQLIASALDAEPARDRVALALGSILCGYAIDSGGFAIHHVVCQTLVRFCGSPHAGTNATILPRAMAFMASRAPEAIDALASAVGTDSDRIEARLLTLGGNPPGLGELGADRSKLPDAVEAILMRPELGFTPGAPTKADLEELIERAW